MQGQSVQVDQIVALTALVLMLGMTSYLGAAYSPKLKSNPEAGNPGEQAELLKKFMQLNPELQRGALKYASEMREGYKKSKGGRSRKPA